MAQAVEQSEKWPVQKQEDGENNFPHAYHALLEICQSPALELDDGSWGPFTSVKKLPAFYFFASHFW